MFNVHIYKIDNGKKLNLLLYKACINFNLFCFCIYFIIIYYYYCLLLFIIALLLFIIIIAYYYLLLLSPCLLALDELLVLHLLCLFLFLYVYLPSFPLYSITLP